MTKKTLTKILIVDDDEDVLTIAKYSLESLKGVVIKVVNSGEAAVRESREFLPDLILLDYRMPQMDGLTTFKVIRSFFETASIPIVFLSASMQEEDRSIFLKEGASGVIAKPFDALTLASEVKTIWERQASEELL